MKSNLFSKRCSFNTEFTRLCEYVTILYPCPSWTMCWPLLRMLMVTMSWFVWAACLSTMTNYHPSAGPGHPFHYIFEEIHWSMNIIRFPGDSNPGSNRPQDQTSNTLSNNRHQGCLIRFCHHIGCAFHELTLTQCDSVESTLFYVSSQRIQPATSQTQNLNFSCLFACLNALILSG